MTRRMLVMAFLVSLPKLLTWLKREAGYRKIRAALHAGVGTFPRRDGNNQNDLDSVEQLARTWQQERRRTR